MKKVVGFLLVFVLMFSMVTISYADSSLLMKNDFGFKIENRDGQIYLDGLPYFSSKDSEKVNPNNNDLIIPFGLYPTDKWCVSTDDPPSYYNTAYDRDYVHVKNSGLGEFTLETTSETTAKITGSLKFNFADIAEANMTIEAGKTWGKTFTQKVINPIKGRTYQLESYCKVLQTNYLYFYYDVFNIFHSLNASTHDKFSTEYVYDWVPIVN